MKMPTLPALFAALALSWSWGCGQARPDASSLAAARAAPSLCAELVGHVGQAAFDASPVIAACIARTSEGGLVELPAGKLYLQTLLVIGRAVTLQTQGTGEANLTACDPRRHACAALTAGPNAAAFQAADPNNYMVRVDASGGAINHVVFDMGLKTAGILMNGQNTRIVRNGFTGARRTAFVNATAAGGTVVAGNVAVNNGLHAAGAWSDGFTFLGADRLTVEGNLFVDGTDVDLIFGGCVGCSIRGNTIQHTGDARRGSFAALAIYTWEHTSGNYLNTVISGNQIDCNGVCGFGAYIGSYSWNDGPPIQNGLFDGNNIVRAQIGIYIDHAVNVTVTDNNGVLAPARGQWATSCGKRYGPAVLMMATDPLPNSIIQIGIGQTAPNLFQNHKTIMDLRGCVPNWP